MTRLRTVLTTVTLWQASSGAAADSMGPLRKVYEVPLTDQIVARAQHDEVLFEYEIEGYFTRFLQGSMSMSFSPDGPVGGLEGDDDDDDDTPSTGGGDDDGGPQLPGNSSPTADPQSPTSAPPTNGSSTPNSPPSASDNGAPTSAPVISGGEGPTSGSGQTPESETVDSPSLAPASTPTTPGSDPSPVGSPTSEVPTSGSDPAPVDTSAPVVSGGEVPTSGSGQTPGTPPVDSPSLAPASAPTTPGSDPSPAGSPTSEVPTSGSDPAPVDTSGPVVSGGEVPTSGSGQTPESPPVDSPSLAPASAPTTPGSPTSEVPTSGSDPAPVDLPTGGASYPTPGSQPPTQDDIGGSTGPCVVLGEDRPVAIRLAVTVLAGDSWMSDTSSSRYQALYWLENVDQSNFCASSLARIQQRFVVALLYFHMNGPKWSNCSATGGACVQDDPNNEGSTIPATRFLDASHECYWFGLECEKVVGDDLHVDIHKDLTLIELPSNNLAGDLFVELFSLTELKVLTMDGNEYIFGQIPPEVGNLSGLKFLDLDSNRLEGQWPSQLYTLSNLEALDMNSNNFSGQLSDEIAKLENLVVLQIENNAFSGPVPTNALLELNQLVLLTMEGNDFTGSLEPICDVIPDRRVDNDYAIYLRFFHVDCAGDPPEVECSCCTCY